MFERYCYPAKRAIYFARFFSHAEKAPDIDSVNLLRGLMCDDGSRVNTTFGLREFFPTFGGPWNFSSYDDIPKPDVPLHSDARQIVRRAVVEADALGDHWIDTEHLLLAIMAH